MKRVKEDYRSLLVRYKETKCEMEMLNGELTEAYSNIKFLELEVIQANAKVERVSSKKLDDVLVHQKPSKHVNEVNISSLEQQIASLTSLVRQMVVGNMQMVKACGICSVVGHPTDMCPTLQKEPIEQVHVAGGF